MSSPFECRLYDPTTKTHRLITLSDEGEWTVRRSLSDDSLEKAPLVNVIRSIYDKDDGSLALYTEDGTVIVVSQQTHGPTALPAMIGMWESELGMVWRVVTNECVLQGLSLDECTSFIARHSAIKLATYDEKGVLDAPGAHTVALTSYVFKGKRYV